MTRQDQKAAERATLDVLLSALAIMPDAIEPNEAPDFAQSFHRMLTPLRTSLAAAEKKVTKNRRRRFTRF
jgi:hypothetical protein